MQLVACIEWLFQKEHPDFASRIDATRAAGLDGVSMHLWRDKPLDAIEAALQRTGLRMASLCVDPRASLVDPDEHPKVLGAIRDAIPVARRLGGAGMIVASGFTRAGVPDAEQQSQAIAVLRQAAKLAEDSGTMVLFEPVNMTVNGACMFVDGVRRGLDIVETVASPGLRLLCDVYHSAVTGEVLADAIGQRAHWIGHVEFADSPGRHEPGTGTLDWPAIMRLLRGIGYDGTIGFEYLPTLPTMESLALARRTIGL